MSALLFLVRSPYFSQAIMFKIFHVASQRIQELFKMQIGKFNDAVTLDR